MTDTTVAQSIVRFKDNRYSAETLHSQSGSGPMIDITSDELHENFTTIVSSPSIDMPEEMSKRTPVFAKYEGKYVVLLGLGLVVASCRSAKDSQPFKLKGRLLSNPMLKRCILD